jgi:hypothetical protein
MYVKLDIAAGRCQVHEAEDLKRFSVRATERADPEELSRALGSFGQLATDDHAWINIDALRAESGHADDLEWAAGFDGMIAYATSKGWVDESGERVRAHLEFDPAPR